ncbi:ubiquitin-like protein Pup [Luteococcus sp.]|uniref:ubiquitin-like protein Pup n=1 Tax=Luteococcus sp. TaxID=1969402 RepID=UPI003734CC7A
MSEQQRIQRPGSSDGTDPETGQVQQQGEQRTDDGFEALLDEIDGVLETNAAEYVHGFVQKGGQ